MSTPTVRSRIRSLSRPMRIQLSRLVLSGGRVEFGDVRGAESRAFRGLERRRFARFTLGAWRLTSDGELVGEALEVALGGDS